MTNMWRMALVAVVCCLASVMAVDIKTQALLERLQRVKEGDLPAPVLERTATGDPVISANANEIIQVHTGPKPKASEDIVGAAKEELRQTMTLVVRKREESLEKHNQEQLFKSREQEKKGATKEIKQEKFEEHLKVRKEEGSKGLDEQAQKKNMHFTIAEKLADKKQDFKIKAIKRESNIDRAETDAEKSAWETSVDLDNKKFMEETRKSKEGDIKFKTEKDRKSKRQEAQKKMANELKTKTERQSKRSELDQKAVAEKTAKQKQQREDAAKAKAKEEITKERREESDKNREKERKNTRKADEQKTKTKEKTIKDQERHKKEKEVGKKKEEGDKKEKEKKSEATNKKEDATWCHCTTHRERWNAMNTYYKCPGDKFIAGISRNGDGNHLSGITGYYCCNACRKGSKVIPKGKCMNAGWKQRFSRYGWGECPKGHFLKGIYKGNANRLHGIHYGYCCTMKDARGWSGEPKNFDWGRKFDHAGMHKISTNYFMTGVMRNHCDKLYCLEQVKGVKAFANLS